MRNLAHLSYWRAAAEVAELRLFEAVRNHVHDSAVDHGVLCDLADNARDAQQALARVEWGSFSCGLCDADIESLARSCGLEVKPPPKEWLSGNDTRPKGAHL
jgi:hypothetical protein